MTTRDAVLRALTARGIAASEQWAEACAGRIRARQGPSDAFTQFLNADLRTVFDMKRKSIEDGVLKESLILQVCKY